MNCPHCGMPINGKIKYYELQTTPSGSAHRQIYHNNFYTEIELLKPETQKYIEELKNGEYWSYFVHLIEISEQDYFKYKNMA